MKQRLFLPVLPLMLVMIVLALALVGCGSPDDSPDPFVGTWRDGDSLNYWVISKTDGVYSVTGFITTFEHAERQGNRLTFWTEAELRGKPRIEMTVTSVESDELVLTDAYGPGVRIPLRKVSDSTKTPSPFYGRESPSASETGGETSPEARQASPTAGGAGSLLIVRGLDGVWQVVRVTPRTGAEQAIATLPFRPWFAVASPDQKRVLYRDGGRRLAVVDAATGTVQEVSLAGLPIRSVDGATWTGAQRFLFGGSRRSPDYASPENSSLYQVDVRTGKVSGFRGFRGSEPSFATGDGSLIYVTRRTAGDTAHETIWRLRSLTARPRPFVRAAEYWEAGRSFDTPLLSPEGAWVLSPRTGTDVSVTYTLFEVPSGRVAFRSEGASLPAAAWVGGGRVAFQQVHEEARGLGLFVYDTSDGSLTPQPIPDRSGVRSLAWSREGGLALSGYEGRVWVSSAAGLGEWVDLGAGSVPVWVK